MAWSLPSSSVTLAAALSSNSNNNKRHRRTTATTKTKVASIRIFEGTRREVLLGARENLLGEIERKNEVGAIEGAIQELSKLYDAEEAKPAKSELIRGTWRLVWSKQSGESNPFQKILADFAKNSNFQIVGADVVINDVQLCKGKLRVKAFAEANVASNARLNVNIKTVDVTMFGQKVKTFELEPQPGKGAGYIDVLYLDEKTRVSVGNKGSIFVHERESSIEDSKSTSSMRENEEEKSLAIVKN